MRLPKRLRAYRVSHYRRIQQEQALIDWAASLINAPTRDRAIVITDDQMEFTSAGSPGHRPSGFEYLDEPRRNADKSGEMCDYVGEPYNVIECRIIRRTYGDCGSDDMMGYPCQRKDCVCTQ